MNQHHDLRPIFTKRVRRQSFQAAAGNILLYGALLALSALFLLPFYLIVRNAFMPDRQIAAFEWHWLPAPIKTSNFHSIFPDANADMLVGLLNSTVIAVITTALQLFFSSMAGYALARLPVRGGKVVFALVISTLMIPIAVTFVPTYAVVAAMGGVNTYWAMIAPSVFTGFATLLFRQFYLDFPLQVEEAGRIDGAGYFGIYWRLLVPNSKAVFAAVGAMAFVGSWNAFLWPLVVGQDQSRWTAQVVVSTFLTSQNVRLGPLFMAAAVVSVPPLAVFILLQRWIVQGTRATGSKE